ncbi:MAG TPA: TerC/Alx family metal homeostasis membrane protein [Candidatus Acidoferrales bacterium]|nr:TerC/Alx family metal homeostasis membrane protein [Candidatus Acidoferrales bacterium]
MAHTSLWIYFTAGLLFFIFIDLLVFGRKPHTISIREAAGWSALWIALSLAFCVWLWIRFGHAAGMEFLSGYLIEKSLSVDNLFIFVLIFHYFSVRAEYQHRVLVWGILGALTLRGAMIAAGAAFINSFSWSYFIFGAFLIFAALHILLRKNSSHSLESNRALRWLSKTLPVARTDAGGKFFTREDGRRLVTPIFLALLTIETADVFFAVDSIPAVFGVTRDPFLVFSSNACAILGLRALYFVLAGWIERLRHLATGIAIILLFIGAKMVTGRWLEISSGVSLAVIAFVLALAVAASLVDKRGAADTRVAAVNPDPCVKDTSLELSTTSVPALIAQLESTDATREAAARELFRRGRAAAELAIASWRADSGVSSCISNNATVGIAVTPARFAKIRSALANPPLAAVPPDQDAEEFEWSVGEDVHLDILTTRAPFANGAIAKFLAKFGEGIQQVEFLTNNVHQATRLLRSRLAMNPIYPQTREGANGTRVNFFLAGAPGQAKVLIELVEQKV